MKKRILFLISAITVTFLLYTACTKDDDDTLENLVTIEISPEEAFFEPGSTQQFTATGIFSDGTSRDISGEADWSSSSESVATVNASGLATGVSKGSTYITALNGTIAGSASVTVVAAADLERMMMIEDYNTNYLGSENNDCGWTGDVTMCDEGTISGVSYDRVIQRINYFRRLCGLYDSITLKADYSEKCQVAALMFKANNTISHYPPSNWQCFDPDGEEAAGKSNIAIGFHTTSAVTAYIEDFGPNNLSVGHRRWFLYTKANKMGEGSTTNTNAIWVFDHMSSAPAGTPAWVAYPSKGYFPGPLVFPRWSFMMPGATFGSATVTMTDENGGSVPVSVIDRYTGGGLAGDPAIVWEPSGVNSSGPGDTKYTVTIDGITGSGQSTVTYDVIIVQPTSTKMSTEYERIRQQNPDARVM